MEPTRLTFTPSGIAFVAVAAECNRHDPFNTHAGILYRANGVVRHLHLCWHHFVQDNATGSHSQLVVVEPRLPPERARFFPRLCQRIAARYSITPNQRRATDRHRSLPYALRHPSNARFVITTGELVDYGSGLNCCSFVLILFSSYGFEIANPTQWPLRDADATWHEFLVNQLARTDPNHAAQIREQIGCQRIRPEEVAGACMCNQFPVPFVLAEQASRIVLPYLSLRPEDCYYI